MQKLFAAYNGQLVGLESEQFTGAWVVVDTVVVDVVVVARVWQLVPVKPDVLF